MGYDLQRFKDTEIDDEFICSICSGVFEKPVQISKCEHIFCASCILQWLNLNKTCPIDRNKTVKENLIKVPLSFSRILKRFTITCDYAENGCDQIMQIYQLNHHQISCKYKPETAFLCEWGCDTMLTIREYSSHDCRDQIKILNQKDTEDITMMELENILMKQKDNLHQLEGLYEKLGLRFNIKRSKVMRDIKKNQQRDFIEWSKSLPTAKIGYWAGLLFANKSNLTNETRDALIEANCPLWFSADFAKNCLEKYWPNKFNTFMKRRINRKLYEKLKFRRLPQRDIVLLLKFENDVDDDVLQVPGIIIHFVCGVHDAQA